MQAAFEWVGIPYFSGRYVSDVTTYVCDKRAALETNLELER